MRMKNLLIVGVVLLFIVVGFVFANNGFGDNCRCKSFCFGQFNCTRGCGYDGLDGCYNHGVPAEPCPFLCPLCNDTLISPCLDSTNNFIFGLNDVGFNCTEFFETLIEEPYCRQTIHGNVYVDGADLVGARVIPLGYIDGVSFRQYFNNVIHGDSDYSITIPRCGLGTIRNVDVVGAKVGFDSDVVRLNISTDQDGVINQDFDLLPGSCNADCTDAFNRCSPACHGYIDEEGNMCKFYEGQGYELEDIQNKCAYRLSGSQVILQILEDTDEYKVLNCCDGEPHLIKRPKSDIVLRKEKNLVVIERHLLYGLENVVLKLYYWDD